MRGTITEATHRGSAVVVDDQGSVVASWGDPTQVMYYRSAIKPFQAKITQDLGADLPPEHLAVACSSHVGSDDLLGVLAQAAREQSRVLRVQQIYGAATDHPVRPGFPEGQYLCALFCWVD